MFSRTIIPRVVAKRAIAPRAMRPFTKLAEQKQAEVITSEKVPVTSFHGGEQTRHELNVAKEQPVSPPGADAHKHAIAMDPSLLSKMTPTLQRFTCPGKVAVVTG